MEDDDAIERIAIVGMSGAFPGAKNIDELWNLLCEKKDGVSTLTREELLQGGETISQIEHPSYVARGGFVEDAEVFDHEFFGYSPSDALSLDPQQRLFLTHARLALEDSGVLPETNKVPVGVYAGESPTQYWFLLRDGPYSRSLEDFKLMLGNEKDFIATRTAYKLNLKGPSLDIQSACSTGLATVALACQALLTWSCDLALAGAATVTAPRKRGYTAFEGMISSPTGACRPFDEHADGTLFGEGVGVVCLKRLSEAIADGNYIYAVIDSVAMNNDGSEKVGFTAPSVNGQAEVIELAQSLAGVRPIDIGYVEAHGTATPLGDPIEIQALTQAFRRGTKENAFCRIGSIKANIGHLDAAAGIVALIKAALVVNTGKIPPMLHFSRPNPHLELDTTPFVVNSELALWSPEGRPRIAGVSSFGIGGTNVHAILESPPETSPSRTQQSTVAGPLLLSAKTSGALSDYAATVARFLESHPDIPMEDLVSKIQRIQAEHPYRRAFPVESRQTLLDELVKPFERPARAEKRRVIFAFPGQGAQFPAMAKAYYGKLPVFTQWLERGLKFAESLGMTKLRGCLFEDGFEADIARTENTQPLLYLIEVSLAQEVIAAGVIPAGLTGHSIGEFAAAVIGGALDFEAGLRLVHGRASAMQRASEGAMVALTLESERVTRYLGPGVFVCVQNTDLQVVLGGTLADIDALEAKLTADGVEFKRLRTSHAFHSPMMESILPLFEADVAATSFGSLKIPILSSMDGRWKTGSVDWKTHWVSQLRNPVRFDLCISDLASTEPAVVLEIGPGRTLTGFLRTSIPEREDVFPLLPNAKATALHFNQSLMRLWERGLPVTWGERAAAPRSLVLFPGYPFARNRFWPSAMPSSTRTFSAPANVESVPVASPETSSSIVRIRGVWTKILGHSDFDDTTSFFLCGADSFGGIQLLRALQQDLGLELKMGELMSNPTVVGLADRLHADPGTPAKGSRYMFAVQTKGSNPPLFVVAGAHQNHSIDAHTMETNYETDFHRYFSNLIPTLGEDQPLYGFRPKGLMAAEPLHSSVAVMAELYIEAMKEVQPRGPYYIGGECVGGVLALEIACQLQERGEQVGRLFLLDTPKPTPWVAFREDALAFLDWIRWDIRSEIKEMIQSGPFKAAQKLGRWGSLVRQTFFPISETSRRLRRAMNSSRLYMKRLLSHSARTFEGPVSYLINRAWNRSRYIMGWKRQIGTDLEVREIPGEHQNRLTRSGRLIGKLIRDGISRPL